MVILAVISFFQVSDQLADNSQNRLHREALNLGMSIMERLIFAEAEMDVVSTYYAQSAEVGLNKISGDLMECFGGLAIISQDGSLLRTLLGDTRRWPALTTKLRNRIITGKALIFTSHRDDGSALVFMGKKIKDKAGREITFLAEIKSHYLLGLPPEEQNTFGTVRVSIAERGRIIVSTMTWEQNRNLMSSLMSNSSPIGSFSWSQGKDDYLASKAPLFLASRFNGPLWTLVLSEPKAEVYMPVASFKYTFILVTILALVVVMLLSTNQIRRYLVPLERLQEGTLRITKGDFSSRVDIKSNDEFEDLADSFNTMATKVDQQFKALDTMASIDRAILSVLDSDMIINTFLKRIGDILPCDAAGVCFRQDDSGMRWINHIRSIFKNGDEYPEIHRPNEEDLSLLQNNPEFLILTDDGPLPLYLMSLVHQGLKSFLVLPVIMNRQIKAIAYLASFRQNAFSRDYQIHARQVTDRMAVAFSNAYLVHELNNLNWGTLKALARVVDAKSPWTAGHSERVAAMAVKIGEALRLNRRQIDDLGKAGMLHDIGKVSTPRAILDKPSKLTAEEYGIIKEHPEKGASILEPITQYAEMIPVVLQHHERYDGQGYPKGLLGPELTLGARILAVADAFDAMTSDRPYRRGMNIYEAVREIKQEAGQQFDPRVVQAFLRVMAEDDLKEKCA
jgi:putative nucleotidyltransferase with HDIG domain